MKGSHQARPQQSETDRFHGHDPHPFSRDKENLDRLQILNQGKSLLPLQEWQAVSDRMSKPGSRRLKFKGIAGLKLLFDGIHQAGADV